MFLDAPHEIRQTNKTWITLQKKTYDGVKIMSAQYNGKKS